MKISMDGRGRALENIYIERFWRTLKQQEVYLNEYASPKEARRSIAAFIYSYNYFKPHQGVQGKTPAQIYNGTEPVSFDTITSNYLDILSKNLKSVS